MSRAEGCLAFDFGFRMGYAFVKPDAIPQSGSYPIGGSSEALGVAGRSLDGVARQLILKFRPSLLAYSSPWFGPKSDLDLLRPIIGWGMVVEMIADELHLECIEVNETEARHALMGFVPQRRIAIKRAVMTTMRHRGWPCKDADAADATCVACHALSIHEPENAHTIMPLFQGKSGKARKKK
jgi:hypothetical protein